MNSPRQPESDYDDRDRLEVIKKQKLKPFKGMSLPSMID